MNATEQPPSEAPKAKSPALAMIANLVTAAAVSGVLIVVVFQLTLPTIKANKAEALRKAVFVVLPHTVRLVTFVADNDTLKPATDADKGGKRVYAGYDDHNHLVGVAVQADGKGFQDVITVIYGYAPEARSIVGMQVLDSKETPGLGDKIGKDPTFLANFANMDVRFDDAGGKLLHEIAVVKAGTKTERWQIDAITGATISSKAVGKLISESVKENVPRIRRNLPVLERPR